MVKNEFNMMEKFLFDKKSGKEPYFVAVYRFKGAQYNPGKFKLLLEAKNEGPVPDELKNDNKYCSGWTYFYKLIFYFSRTIR